MKALLLFLSSFSHTHTYTHKMDAQRFLTTSANPCTAYYVTLTTLSLYGLMEYFSLFSLSR